MGKVRVTYLGEATVEADENVAVVHRGVTFAPMEPAEIDSELATRLRGNPYFTVEDIAENGPREEVRGKPGTLHLKK